MNVLLIGGCSSFINNLIIKLKKEGHRVYLLTGSRYQKHSYQKVFERYDFPYDASCLNEIFESVNPDVTIYMGAYDTNYAWKNEESESVKYNACMLNILMGYIMKNSGRFIYLSSEEVFEGNYVEDITEDMILTPRSFKNMALAQAEAMCENYRVSCEKDIIVLRLEHVYSLPEYLEDVTDPCTKKCLQALESGVISVSQGESYSLLFVSDAIEFMYRLLVSKKHQYSLYNLASDEEIMDVKLAEIIRSYLGFDVELVVVGTRERRKVLSGKRFHNEFGGSFLCNNEDVIKKVIAQMKKYRHVFVYGGERKEPLIDRIFKKTGWIVKVLVPFIENFAVFILSFMINNRSVGSKYFANLDFYLLYVLLFAIIYGQKQAILSAILAVMGYCFRQMYDRSGLELMVDSNTYVWIAQLFILGLAVGYMRDYITKLKFEQKSEQDFLNMQLGDIKEINDSNVRVKDALQVQIVNQNDSVGKIYSITSSLDQYSQEEVLFYAADMVSKLVKSKDVAIYTVSNKVYARLFSSTSKYARVLGNSVKYKELGEMYEVLSSKNVYINRKLDEKFPLMASAIFDEQDVMQMIIMIWDLPWESMTLGQANQLTVIGALIRDAVVRANRYLAALEEERYIEGTKLLDADAFSSLVAAYMKAARQGFTDCMVLRLENTNQMDFGEVSNILADKMRDHDYAGLLEDGNIYILLSNTNFEDAKQVVKRLADIGFESEILGDSDE
ncbi:MAG: NAD(P)-dependent oxidoreductase [Eubacteriales bacterium]|nr:NAD(P)-dependent oxidoreductase [Eubacteriales bacterium]